MVSWTLFFVTPVETDNYPSLRESLSVSTGIIIRLCIGYTIHIWSVHMPYNGVRTMLSFSNCRITIITLYLVPLKNPSVSLQRIYGR